MKAFKAVEFMRKVRNDLDRKYAELSMDDRLKRIHDDVRKSDLWKKLSKRHRIAA